MSSRPSPSMSMKWTGVGEVCEGFCSDCSPDVVLFHVNYVAVRQSDVLVEHSRRFCNRDRPPATRDATLIERMEASGAVLVGALNMGEYAYDFTGENVHDGPSRNPHDPTRMSGGSSGGSGSAVGGGLVPIALGSDTNGSIRVPSSFCGIFGLKPTYGRLSRARSYPFVASLDHLGPFARNVRDLALASDAMQGPDADDAACTMRPTCASTFSTRASYTARSRFTSSSVRGAGTMISSRPLMLP